MKWQGIPSGTWNVSLKHQDVLIRDCRLKPCREVVNAKRKPLYSRYKAESHKSVKDTDSDFRKTVREQ